MLTKGYGKYSLRKESAIAPFVEWFKTVRKSSSWVLLVLRAIQFSQPFHFSLPLPDRKDCQQGGLQKEPVTATFIERFKTGESMEL